MIGHDEAARLAQAVLELRRRRSDHLPAELFGEPAWGILLVTFVADAAGERIGTDEVCQRAGGPLAVARRWIRVLEQRGLLASRTDPGDGSIVALTPAGVHAVEACMNDAQEQFGTARRASTGA